MSALETGAAPGPRGGSIHEVGLVPGMSWQELARVLEAVVPAAARFVEVDGDVDITLRWEVDNGPDPLDRLVAAEAAAWRVWRDAEDRQHDFVRLHRHASAVAGQAHEAWRAAASELARRHPGFDELTRRT